MSQVFCAIFLGLDGGGCGEGDGCMAGACPGLR